MPDIAFAAKNDRVPAQVVEGLVHEHIGVEVHSALVDKPFQSRDVSTMRWMIERSTEDLAGGGDLLAVDELASLMPPEPLRFKLEVEACFGRLECLDGARDADEMAQSKWTVPEVFRKSKAEVQDVRNAKA